jgi:uncharacterized membrane protein
MGFIKDTWSNIVLKYGFTFAFIIGVFYIFVIPPFHTPDEFNHFYRSYQITDGHFLGEFNHDSSDVGGYIPKSLHFVGAPFEYMATNRDITTDFKTITHNLLYPLNKQDTEFVSFVNTARYFPICYTPQIVTISILKQFNCPPLLMMYIGRFVCLLFGLYLFRLAVRITPVLKEYILILAILPANLSICASLNADTFTNGLLFIILAYFLKFKSQETLISKKDKRIVLGLLFVSTITKLCYFPILFLFLLVPNTHFTNLKNKITFISAALIGCALIFFVWNKTVRLVIYPNPNNINKTTYINMRPDALVNPDLQIQFMKDHPIEFLQEWNTKSFMTYFHNWVSYLRHYGWDGYGHPGTLWSIFSYLFIALILIQKNYFNWLDRLWLLIVGHGLTMLFILSQHIHWDSVGTNIIHHYIGKYWVPIYPILLLSLSGLLHKFKDIATNKFKLEWIFLFVYLVAQVDNLIIAFERYYLL